MSSPPDIYATGIYGHVVPIIKVVSIYRRYAVFEIVEGVKEKMMSLLE